MIFHGRRVSTNGPISNAQVNTMRGCAKTQMPAVSRNQIPHLATRSCVMMASKNRSVAYNQNGSSVVARPNAISGPEASIWNG